MNAEIRIYVACLASYNAGKLHGVWIDAEQDEIYIWAAIKAMLAASPCPNVVVECLTCEGEGKVTDLEGDDGNYSTCATCNGEGKVPSAEEWAVHDHEGFEGINLGENPDILHVSALASLLSEHGKPFAVWYCNENSDRPRTRRVMEMAFEESYAGRFDSLADYAENYIEETCDLDKLPDIIRNHIDFEGIAREMEINSEIWTENDGGDVLVFRNI